MKPLRAVPLVVFGLALALNAQENPEKARPENNRKAVPRERPAPSAQPQAAPPQRQEPRREAPAQAPRTAPSERRDQMPRSRPDNPPVERQVPRERPQQPQQQAQPQQAQPQRPQPQQPQQQQQAPRQTVPQIYQPRPNFPTTRDPGQARPPNDDRPGRTFGNAPDSRPRQSQPARAYTTRTGDVIHRDSSGQVRQVRTNTGTVVYRPVNGPRRVEMQRSGGGVIVAAAPGRGYVQRPVVVRNTTIIKRTYVYNGAPHARLYRPRMYNGVSLAVYMPVRYYRPGFYSWAYNPWAQPVRYSWGWYNRPWYGYYGGYFSPYPVYASPALWLTDFMLAAILESAYEDRMASRAYASSQYYDPAPPEPMSPEVKQAVADEVRRQIDRERAEGQQGGSFDNASDNVPFADNSPHVFVVSAGLTVDSNNGECSLGEGDVLQMTAPPRPNATYGDLVVLASRGRACPKGSRVEVGLQDLQEMQNQMRATLDRGLGDLQSRQGQDGLPRLPEGSSGTIDSAYAREAQPDSDAARELTDASREADRVEQEAASQSGTPPVLSLGMSLDEVRAIQGNPRTIVDLGEKKMYVYQDLKITFLNGKVTDIQ